MRNFSIRKFLFCALFIFGMTGVNPSKGHDGFVRELFEREVGNDSLPGLNEGMHLNEFENENILQPGESIKDKIKKNLFVVARVSRSECFVGEPITVTYKLYSRLNATSSIMTQPLFTGFSKHDIVKVPGLNPLLETIGGKKFQVHILRQTELIPMIAGNLEIDAMEVEHRIHFIESDSHSTAPGGQLTDFLDQKKAEEQRLSKFFTVNTRSSPVEIRVRETPEENKPSGYSGAVGSFSIKTSFSSQKIMAGQTARLILEIKGSGTLLGTESPVISLPENVELLSAKPVAGSYKTGAESTTSRSFEYVLHFRESGVVEIPAISFSYFDPVKRTYQTKHSMPVFTEILESPGQINRKVARTEPGRAVNKSNSSPQGQRTNVLLLFIIAIAGCVVLFWKKVIGTHIRISAWLKQDRRKRPEQDADTPAARAAGKLSIVKAMESRDLGTYYYELNRILWSVITEKVNLLPTELSKGNIFLELSRQGWTAEEIWELELTMNEYERNLYVPGYRDENNFDLAYDKAVGIISRLEMLGR